MAERFISELHSSLAKLCGNPGIGSPRYAHFLPDRSLRVWQLRQFPFLIFYRVDQSTLAVLRVLHERRALTAEIISS
nr:type II toxin-antitoxin system RelE/ParE family toxin [Pseudoduganella aquatica]